jgi:DUF1365 family protein
MLAEVSNTPWNQRHYYLVNLNQATPTQKDFHVSPFMDMNMQYHWQIKPPKDNNKHLLIHIENRRHQQTNSEPEKLFDATLAMEQYAFTQQQIWRVFITLPVMTIKVLAGIYWQALKLFIKRIPFYSIPKK